MTAEQKAESAVKMAAAVARHVQDGATIDTAIGRVAADMADAIDVAPEMAVVAVTFAVAAVAEARRVAAAAARVGGAA